MEVPRLLSILQWQAVPSFASEEQREKYAEYLAVAGVAVSFSFRNKRNKLLTEITKTA